MNCSSAPLLDFISSAQARDAGIDQTAQNNREWMALGLLQIEQLAWGSEGWANLGNGFTGEDLRRILTPLIGKPSSPHGWGSLCMHAIRRKLIVNTGRYVPMREVKSHARKTAVYQLVNKQ